MAPAPKCRYELAIARSVAQSLKSELTFGSLQDWLQHIMDPSDNCTFQTIADTFRAGCVALVNRSSNQEALQAVSITEQLGRESDFFLRSSGMHAFLSSPQQPINPQQPAGISSDVEAQVTLNELGHSCLGLPALLSRIDIIIRLDETHSESAVFEIFGGLPPCAVGVSCVVP